MSPKISVILPVYNGQLFVKAAVDSILTQSCGDFELLIINDGSTDDTEKIILGFDDRRIRYIRNDRNLGLIATLNKGLDLAKGEYIARMDNDDIALPTRLEKQLAYMEENKHVAVLATKLVIINERGFEVDHWPEDVHTSSVEEIKNTMPVTNCIGHPTVMMRAADVKEIRYNPSFKNSEDWALWLTMLSRGKVIAKLNEVLLQYRVHQKSATVSSNQTGVVKKVLSFKLAYCIHKLLRFDLRGTDRKVLSSLVKETLRHIFRPVLGPFVRLFRIGLFQTIKQYSEAKAELRRIGPVRIVYFFPFYHTGGAEKVHESILEAVNEKQSIVFITGRSEDELFLRSFRRFSNVIEIDRLISWGPTRSWIIKRIISLCAAEKVTVLGCNAFFFYELVPRLPGQTRIIDLVHAFLHLNESGPEKWSLPFVHLFDRRIVINQRTKKDFERLYQAHGIDAGLVSRITCIPNFVETKPLPARKQEGPLTILYAGRGSEEKRLHIIAKAAYELKQEGLSCEFHFVGDVKNYIPAEYLAACILHGKISSEQQMDALYAKAHMLVITSSREGFPMVIMEAMMQGAVPIATDVGGIAEHVLHETNGILLQNKAEEQIVKDLKEYVRHYSAARNELENLSKAAHAYALKNFNKDHFFNSYLQLLKQ